MARVILPLDWYNFLGSVNHLCPRGPIATGLGPDWSEERDVIELEAERCSLDSLGAFTDER